MDDNLKDFVINILLIFSPLVFYPYLHIFKHRGPVYRMMLYVLLSLALLTAMTCPANLGGVVYDFRSVPLALGVLYGGAGVTAGLVAAAITYRYLLGYPETLLYAIALFSSLSFTVLSNLRLKPVAATQKVILSMVYCTMIKLIVFAIYFIGTGTLSLFLQKPFAQLQTYLLQAVITGFCTYFIEFLDRYYTMQEELIWKEKANIVSHIAASVAHEIRNPLTSVRGFIQLFGNDNLDVEKRKFYQKVCLEELDRAQHIITDYLTLAKPDPEVIEQINVHEEIRYVANVLKSYANFSNTEIITIMDEWNGPLLIQGDRSKFRQALINIGKNAIESMPYGGLMEFKAVREDAYAAILVKDTGSGMTEAQMKRLGTPYYSTKEKGTGLGTMVSFHIIKNMNGKIKIQSELGKGTCFILTFPLIMGDRKQERAELRRIPRLPG